MSRVDGHGAQCGHDRIVRRPGLALAGEPSQEVDDILSTRVTTGLLRPDRLEQGQEDDVVVLGRHARDETAHEPALDGL